MGLNVIMLGPPGAGKGTQAERFARARGVPKISTGDILRGAIKEGLPVALQAKAKMDRGELVDDETIVEIVRDRLSRPDAQQGFVLDGFPRTVAQARSLDRILEDAGVGPVIVVDLAVPPQELVRRLAERRICSKCGTTVDPFAGDGDRCARCGGELMQRADDNKDVVMERLKVYERDTMPLVEYYRQRPTFRVVNGAQPPERVAEELDTLVDGAALVAGGSPRTER